MPLDFSLSEEQILIKESARKVMSRFEGRRKELREKVMHKKEFPQEIWDAIAEAGFLGALVPPEYGGTGMGLLAVVFATEELASFGFGNALLVLTTMDALCITRSGSEELKRRFLPKIADGSYKFCFAITEPEAGSNSFRITTHAVKKGNTYYLNGQKTFITGWDKADYALVVTRTTPYKEVEAQGLPKAYGMTLFVVDTKSPGIELQPLPTRGIEGMYQWNVFFNNTPVPEENMVGEENGGAMALFKALNPERIMAAASAIGFTEFVFKTVVPYAKERKVFRNTPIGQYQGIQHPLAEVRIWLEAVRLITYKAAWAFDRDLPPVETGFYSDCAKFLGAELALKAVDVGIETLGGNGFSEEFGLIYLWEAARLMKTAPISREMILNYVAEHILNLPRSY
jgi:alkylation response protein AidB-like acyl-CoA dehydrogenase